MRRQASTAWLLLSLAAAGCGGSSPLPPCSASAPTAALQQLALWRQLAPRQSLRAEAKVSKSGREGRLRGTVWLMAQHPDRLRIDLMSPLGPAASFVTDGQLLTLVDMREKRAFQGQACAANVARFLGVGFQVETVVQLLLGHPPIAEGNLRHACQRGVAPEIRLRQADGGEQTLMGSAETPSTLLRIEQRDANQQLLWWVAFSDHRRMGAGAALPQGLQLADVRRGVQLDLRLRDLEVDVPPPAEAFQPGVPEGLPVQAWPCPPE